MMFSEAFKVGMMGATDLLGKRRKVLVSDLLPDADVDEDDRAAACETIQREVRNGYVTAFTLFAIGVMSTFILMSSYHYTAASILMTMTAGFWIVLAYFGIRRAKVVENKQAEDV